MGSVVYWSSGIGRVADMIEAEATSDYKMGSENNTTSII
jgi:hypothetical protein